LDLEQEKVGSAIAIFTACFLVVAGLVWLTNQPIPERDLGKKCLKAPPLEATHHLILLDRSEKFTEKQIKDISDKILDLARDELLPEDRLTIYELGELDANKQGGAGLPVFDKCRPISGQEADGLYQGPELLEEEYQQIFFEPLSKIISMKISGGDKKNSPIMEAIYDIGVDLGKSEFKKKKLIIFSDMVQRTSNFTQVNHPNSSLVTTFDEFSQTRFFSRMNKSKLYGTHVTLHYIARFDERGEIQGDPHRTFWKEYLKALGARVVQILTRK
jgi:hypothetical protein